MHFITYQLWLCYNTITFSQSLISVSPLTWKNSLSEGFLRDFNPNIDEHLFRLTIWWQKNKIIKISMPFKLRKFISSRLRRFSLSWNIHRTKPHNYISKYIFEWLINHRSVNTTKDSSNYWLKECVLFKYDFIVLTLQNHHNLSVILDWLLIITYTRNNFKIVTENYVRYKRLYKWKYCIVKMYKVFNYSRKEIQSNFHLSTTIVL